jgi:hypothetical protein
MKAFIAGLLVLLTCLPLLHAKPVEVPNQQARVDLPDSWTVDTTSEVWMAKDAEKGEVIVVEVTPNEGDATYDGSRIDKFKQGFVAGAQKSGAQMEVGPSSLTTLAGAPGFSFDCKTTYPNGKIVYGHVHVVTANQKLYQVSALAVSESALPDADSVATSFQFDQSPQLPAHDSADYRLGYLIGQITIYLVVFALALSFGKRLFFSKPKQS